MSKYFALDEDDWEKIAKQRAIPLVVSGASIEPVMRTSMQLCNVFQSSDPLYTLSGSTRVCAKCAIAHWTHEELIHQISADLWYFKPTGKGRRVNGFEDAVSTTRSKLNDAGIGGGRIYCYRCMGIIGETVAAHVPSMTFAERLALAHFIDHQNRHHNKTRNFCGPVAVALLMTLDKAALKSYESLVRKIAISLDIIN